MPLSPGSCVGSYEVIAAIGAGGMGEVYRARARSVRAGVRGVGDDGAAAAPPALAGARSGDALAGQVA